MVIIEVNRRKTTMKSVASGELQGLLVNWDEGTVSPLYAIARRRKARRNPQVRKSNTKSSPRQKQKAARAERASPS